MPVSVPRVLSEIARDFGKLAAAGSPEQERFLKTVAKELRPELRRMYETSTDPFGSAWVRQTNGQPAYRSKKMGNAIRIRPSVSDAGALHVRFLIKWLDAADQGHTFPAQSIEANARYLTFDKRGKLIRRDRSFAKQRAGINGPPQLKRGAYQRYAAAHVIKARVLPARAQQPRGVMPSNWGEAVNRGAELGMAEFLRRATGNA